MKNKICSLRKSIYDIAIKGLLLTQNEFDLPFELPSNKYKEDSLIECRDGKLFERIKKTEKELIDAPFELPKGWKFARFKTLYELYTGDSIPQSIKEAKYLKLDSNISTPYIGTKDVGFNHEINYENGVRIPNYELNQFKIAPKNSILFCIEGGSAGKKIGITDRDVCFGNKLMCFKPKYSEMPLVYYFLQSPTFTSLFNDSTTGIITGISKKNLENLLVPVPPIDEQRRIVSKLKMIEPFLDEYEILNNERELLNSKLKNKIWKSLLKDVFDYDELCKKYRCDIKPLGELLDIERGGSPRPIEAFITDREDGLNWIKIGDSQKGSKYIESTSQKIIPEGLKKTRMVYPGDFIISNSMSFGRPYILKIQGCIHDGWVVLRNPSKYFDLDFLFYLISSPQIYSQFTDSAGGAVVQNLNIDKVKAAKVIIPEKDVQKIIVTKLEKLFIEIQKLDSI